MEDATPSAMLERLKIAADVNSDQELALKIGLSKQAIADAKSRNTVPASWIPKAAKLFHVSTDWLFFGTGPIRHEMQTEAMGQAEKVVRNSQPAIQDGGDIDLVMIPRVAARLAAGTGSMETNGKVKGHYAFRSDWIRRKGCVSKMVLMDVTGDSIDRKSVV